MEDNNTNKYLENIQKIIRRGNPKHISYIAKEYMRYRQINPSVSDSIYSMIFNEVTRNSYSPYAVFLDQDGTISLESVSDISKITNVSEFIDHVQELSKLNIDFRDLSSDDLIIEGNEIAEELAQKLENEELTEEEAKSTVEQANKTVGKVGALALIGGTIGAMATSLINRIKTGISKIRTKKIEQPAQEQENQEKPQVKEVRNETSFDEICPKVDVDEEKAIKEMNMAKMNKEKTRTTDTYGDGDPDGDDIDL